MSRESSNRHACRITFLKKMFKAWYMVLIIQCVSVYTRMPPNIIVILADDLGWDDVGFHGSPDIPTPNIDALAYSGVILRDYYVSPICSPSRAALMTGKHPIHLGLQHSTIDGAHPYGLSLDETIMPQYLKELGYATHIVGKWHLGFFAKEYTPTYRGFDSHFGYWNGMEDYLDHTYQQDIRKAPHFWGLDFRRNMNLLRNMSSKFSTELYTTEAEYLIRKHDKTKPLFLYVAQQAVHSSNTYRPLYAPQKYLDKVSYIKHQGRRTFAAMVSSLDDSVGNITAALCENGMLDNSIIVFSTDNGGPAAGFDLNYASNWPLRGVKHTPWEGGVRGTGFIWSPLIKKTGVASHLMMHISDWLPTLYSAAGGDAKRLGDIYGLNVWHEIVNGYPSLRDTILHNIDPITKVFALRFKSMKVVSGDKYNGQYDGWFKPESLNNHNDMLFNKSMESKLGSKHSHQYRADVFNSLTGKILLNHGYLRYEDASTFIPLHVDCGHNQTRTPCKPADRPCLFNIDADPCEYNNLASVYPTVTKLLLDMVSVYNDSAVVPRNKPIDPKADPGLHGGAWVPWIKLGETLV